jgi:diguanylate cyclase (GGDEF)-like protein
MDVLTGSLDIGELMALEEALDQLSRKDGEGRHYGLIVVGIEGLKIINTEFGYDTGNEVLKELARNLRETNPSSPVARVDSDKFAFLVEDAEQGDVSHVASQIKLSLNASPWSVDGKYVIVSVGVVALSGPVTTRQDSHLIWAALRAHRTMELQELKRRLVDAQDQARLGRLLGELGAFRAELAIAIYHRDGLTGLLNRLGYAEVLSTIGIPYALAFVDLDNLRDLNKTPGLLWDAGDQALVAVARLLETIAPDARAMRWGGDEFLVFLPRVTAQTARNLLETHVRTSSDYLKVGSIPITLSGGVASVLEVDGHLSAMDEAEKLASQAKREGRSRILAAPKR